MGCLMGIKTLTALSMMEEIGVFERLEKASKFAGFLALVISEDSGADDINSYGIAKAGNQHLRWLMIEATRSYTRGTVGHKFIALKKRQEECSPDIIAYLDKANERLCRRLYRLTLSKGINRNRAATAIARGLSRFIWEMMTRNVA